MFSWHWIIYRRGRGRPIIVNCIHISLFGRSPLYQPNTLLLYCPAFDPQTANNDDNDDDEVQIVPPPGAGAAAAGAAFAPGAGAAAAGAPLAPGAAAAGSITNGIRGGGLLGHQQAQAAVGPTIVTPAGLRSRNPDHTSLLGEMNRDVAQSLQQLQSLMPTDAERRRRDTDARKASIEASIDSAYKHLAAKKANSMDTTACLEQIDDLEKKLDAIIKDN